MNLASELHKLKNVMVAGPILCIFKEYNECKEMIGCIIIYE